MRAHFHNDLRTEDLPDGVRLRLLADLHYESPLLERLTREPYLTIPAGFVCDLTSLSFLGLRSRGPWNRAAAIHDWLYHTANHACYRLTKSECDAVFAEAMRALHTAPWRRRLYHTGVLLFAWPAWWKHRRREKREAKARRSLLNHPHV